MEDSDYHQFCRQFRRQEEWNDDEPLPFSDGCLYNLNYISKNADYLLGHTSYRCEEHDLQFEHEPVVEQPSDEQIKQNIEFRYPLVRECPSSGALHRHKRVTILLHGLNERSFSKYILWAYPIWQRTKAPVVLFPLTFNINRVLPQWAGQMQETYERRKQILNNENADLFNATISERLERHPERFFWGGVQSYWDIVDFVRQIRDPNGNEVLNKHFAPDARVDFLGYSSGGYLALTLLLENPEGLFGESRACLFASCVTIRNLMPSSPYVVDYAAETALRRLLVDHLDTLPNKRMKHWLEAHPEGRWMRTFCGRSPDQTERGKGLKKLAQRLLGIANTNDEVMPYGAMLNVLQGDDRNTGVRVKRLALGVHENPFAFQCYPDPNQKDHEYRREKLKFVTSFLNKALYGKKFDQFINWIVKHLG